MQGTARTTSVSHCRSISRSIAPTASICEVEPATRPDITHVRHQIGELSEAASAFLISDNHIGGIEHRRSARGTAHGRPLDRVYQCS
jgi:hypothetical protein